MVAVLAGASAQTSPPRQVFTPQVRQLQVNRTLELTAALNKLQISQQTKQAAISDFAKLPAGAQDIILVAVSPEYALKTDRISPQYRISDSAKMTVKLSPRIQGFIPSGRGARDDWVAILGSHLTSDCKVIFANKEIPSHVFANSIITFEVPRERRGVDHPVQVRNVKRNETSNTLNYRVVAPIGYRGTHGWSFRNFTTHSFGWELFRDYFTPTAVEFSNGNRRPSAEEWYNSTYIKIGRTGNCLGMSIRSIRTRLGQWHGLHASWWPNNRQPTVWDYPKTVEVLDSVREDQGSQLCAQGAALISHRFNHQSHLQAWNFIAGSLAANDITRQPIICFWKLNKYGHAVVAYDIDQDSTSRIIRVWDNNKPYVETEFSDENSFCTISKADESFAAPRYDGADKMIALTFNELVYDLPLLPSHAIGSTAGMAAGTTIVVVDAGTTVAQITDQQGRTFFAGNVPNENPATRIPDAMLFYPLGGMGPMPPDYPATFIFNNTSGKSFTFDVSGSSAGTVRVFAPGMITKLQLQRGKFKIDRILTPEQSLMLSNPNTMNISAVDMIAVQPDRTERVFEVRGLQNLQSGNLSMRLASGRNGLQIENSLSGAVQLNLNIKGYSNSGIQQKALPGLSIPRNQIGSVAVQDFRNLNNFQPQFRARPR